MSEQDKRNNRRRNNAVVIGERKIKLTCGHSTNSQPLASLGDKGWYECPEGCGLQKGRR